MTDHSILHRIAAERGGAHGNRYIFGEYIGLVGEDEFGMEYGYPIDLETKNGDRGIDFRTLLGTVDVKTYVMPYHLLAEAGKEDLYADIFVLGRYIEQMDAAVLLGWERGSVLKTKPIRCMPGHNIQNHCIAAGDLRPMGEFFTLHRTRRLR